MVDLMRKPGETEEQFIWRIGRAYDSGEIDLSWSDIAKVINRQFRGDDEPQKDESAYRKAYQYARRFYEAGVFKDLTGEEYLSQIQESKRELQKEKVKLQTEKLEYNRWLREDARDELLAEKFADALSQAPAIDFPDPLPKRASSRRGVLVFGDEHYGTEFRILGLRGEIINEYSPEIFEDRMCDLLDQTISIVHKEGLDEINVYSIGDSVDGVLRVGQLMKLRYGIVEQTVLYANYIANWLNQLSKYVRVNFQMVFGNHSELRFFNQKKGSFKDENTGRYIREIIKARLDGNPNFTICTNPTGLIFDEVEGYNILGIHGEVKDMERALKDFATTYGTRIDILIGGHMHHLREETIGVDKEVINVPSIIGIDDYSISLNKTSRPGATFLIIESGNGVSQEYRIKLGQVTAI